MKLLINLDSLVHPRSGIGYYTENLLRKLLQEHAEIEVAGMWRDRILQGGPLTSLMEEENQLLDHKRSSTLSSRISRFIKPVIRSLPGAYQLRQELLAWRGSRHLSPLDPDICHEPNFIPKAWRSPLVLTVHDMSHIRHPEYHPAERVRYLNRYLPEAIKSAAHIITVSEFTKQELCALHPEAAAKTTAIHLGVSDEFVPRGNEDTSITLEKWGLQHGSYILSAATLEPRKNLAGLVRAYQGLPNSVTKDIPLVLVGGQGWKNQELSSLLSKLDENKHRIILTGRVGRMELSHLMAGARLFAYPSFYEGFGLPVAEAMACGVPVLTSNCGATAEIAGPDAFLVSPHSFIEELEHAILEAPRCQSSEVAAVRYDWSTTAERTIEVYQSVI